MAADGKKKLTVDIDLNPFGEFKGKKAPEWFASRPKLEKLVQGIKIKQDLMVDPRKWKLKDLESGAYSVARYELKIFAVGLGGAEKDIGKQIPKKEKPNAKLWKSYKDKKAAPKEVAGAIDAAEAKVEKMYKKLVKTIQDKVSLALEEVESGKEDSKGALAAGKKALETFDSLDISKMYAEPSKKAVEVLKDLQGMLEDTENNKDALRKAAKDISKDAQDAFEQTAKKVSNVIKFLSSQGKKMKDDKKADVALTNIGTEIVAMKTELGKFENNIDTFEEMLKDVVKDIDGGKITKRDVDKWIKEFEGAQKTLSAGDDARAKLKKISAKFKKAAKDLK